MKFWMLKEPDYKSDYESTFYNGELEHPYALPGIVCENCGETWGSNRVLPYACPEELKDNQHIKNSWPINIGSFNSLMAITKNIFASYGVVGIDFLPGDVFVSPSFLYLPAKHKSDFLWCSVGSLVVAKRIKNLFVENCENEIKSFSVAIKKMGTTEKYSDDLIPDSGEPEDIMKGLSEKLRLNNFNQYFELLACAEDSFLDCNKIVTCSVCKRIELSYTAPKYKKEITKAVFRMTGTGNFVIDDTIKKKLEALEATNVAYVSI
jgi:hypothetical protein